MATICIMVDDMFPGDDSDHIYINYHWFSANEETAASDGGQIQAEIDVSAVLNQAVIDACVAASGDMGVEIGVDDRKIIHGFI